MQIHRIEADLDDLVEPARDRRGVRPARRAGRDRHIQIRYAHTEREIQPPPLLDRDPDPEIRPEPDRLHLPDPRVELTLAREPHLRRQRQRHAGPLAPRHRLVRGLGLPRHLIISRGIGIGLGLPRETHAAQHRDGEQRDGHGGHRTLLWGGSYRPVSHTAPDRCVRCVPSTDPRYTLCPPEPITSGPGPERPGR